MGKQNRAPAPDLYGYSVELVASWCRVSVSTAALWKSGVTKMGPQAVALFELHRDGRILVSPHWDRWTVDGDVLVDPAGNRTHYRQLEAYHVVIQFAQEASKLLHRGGAGSVVQLLTGTPPAAPDLPKSPALRGKRSRGSEP